MPRLLPQFLPVLAVYCFCMLQIPSSGVSQPSVEPPDGLNTVQLERLVYCLNQRAALFNQPKDNQDIFKRFLFHYSRTQEPTYPVKTGLPAVHPLMRLASKLANGKMKRFPQPVCDLGAASVDFTKKDPIATLGRPFFLFRSRNGRNLEDKAQ
uniref:Neuromedin-S n=1 Tax=Spermophilus dauricus TaxID=99837 RepID=A0A8C9PSV1_SPEDA